MDKPPETCSGFNANEFLIDFLTMEFIQTDDDAFVLSGTINVIETIDAAIMV